MFKFCPNCTKETMPGWQCCPYCGYKFEGAGAVNDGAASATASAMDDMLGNLYDYAGEKQEEEQRRALESKLRVMIIRGRYDEAKEICNSLIDADPMDKAGYIGLIRIASKNYKEYEGAEIDEHIRIAEEVFVDTDELLSDTEYAKYISARKQYFEDREHKCKEEEEERKRIAEEERKRKEEEERAKDKFKLESHGDGTYTLAGVKDKSITVALIPDCVSRISNNAFYNCTSLEKVIIPNSVTEIGECAFYSCKSLKSVEIPNSVTEIGRWAFYCCESLKSVTIPNGVSKIEEKTFYSCKSLKSVEIPNSVTKIGDCAFYYCTSLTSVTIPNSVTKIGEHAFHSCASLTRVTISNSVKEIGEHAFHSCASLASVIIPISVAVIGEGAFYYTALKSVTVSAGCNYVDTWKVWEFELSFPKDCVVTRK